MIICSNNCLLFHFQERFEFHGVWIIQNFLGVLPVCNVRYVCSHLVSFLSPCHVRLRIWFFEAKLQRQWRCWKNNKAILQNIHKKSRMTEGKTCLSKLVWLKTGGTRDKRWSNIRNSSSFLFLPLPAYFCCMNVSDECIWCISLQFE